MSFRILSHPRAALFVACLALFSGLETGRAQQLESLLRRRAELTDRVHALRLEKPGYERGDRAAQLQTRLRETQARFHQRRNQLNQQLRDHAGQPAASNADKVDELQRTLRKLQDEKKSALNDLRSGLYCSKCKRTKTEIEATGEPFGSHLERVEGQPVAAPPELIAEKMAEFDANIDALKQELEQLRQRELEDTRKHEDRTTELRRELANLDIEEREELAAIRREIADARAEERRQADDEEARWLDEIRAAEDELNDLEVELDRVEREQRAARRTPNDELPDEWVDAEAGVAFVRFGSAPEPNDNTIPDRVLSPEPYAGPDGESWVPFEIIDPGPSELYQESAPVEFTRENAAIRELLSDADESARDDSAAPPSFATDLLENAPESAVAYRAAYRTLRELHSESKLGFVARAAPRVVVGFAPEFIEASEDVVYRNLTPDQRYPAEVRTRVVLAPVFAIVRGLRGLLHWVPFALKSIPKYVDALTEAPEFSGVNDP